MLKHVFFLMAIAGISVNAFGQVCTGSLGDPVINITFGAGRNPGAAFSQANSSYAYSNKDCPDNGEYAIRNTTFLCNSDSWYSVLFDHTPQDGNNGYFMAINGSDALDYYVNTLTGLCANTTYELSFWVLNLSKPGVACDGSATDPDIKYSIETLSGATIATAKTGAIGKNTEATWRQYNLLFKTGPVPSVILRLSSNGGGGCGMDFLMDDIVVRPCGPSVLAAVATGGFATKACEGDSSSILLNAVIGGGFLFPQYQWQLSINSGVTWTDIAGATKLSFVRSPTAYGEYLYRLVVGEEVNFNSINCRLASNQVNITIEKSPYAQGTNYSYCIGGDVTLFAAGGEKYLWTGPNGFNSNLQSPVLNKIRFIDSGLYKVQVITSAGCKSSDSTHLFIYSNPIATVSSEVSICEGASVNLLAAGGDQYYWTPSLSLSSNIISNPVASPTDSTVYTVLVSRNGCSDTASMRVNVWKKPQANAGADKKMRKGQFVSLNASYKGTDVTYFWTPPIYLNDSRILNPVVSATEDKTYMLHIVSNKGCGQSNDLVQVRVFDKITIPNVFSPNGDGINDNWIIEPLDLFGDTETKVFNRYGQLVFNSKGYPVPWNGTLHNQPLPVGVYYYIIDLKNGQPVYRGSVMIIR